MQSNDSHSMLPTFWLQAVKNWEERCSREESLMNPSQRNPKPRMKKPRPRLIKRRENWESMTSIWILEWHILQKWRKINKVQANRARAAINRHQAIALTMSEKKVRWTQPDSQLSSERQKMNPRWLRTSNCLTNSLISSSETSNCPSLQATTSRLPTSCYKSTGRKSSTTS